MISEQIYAKKFYTKRKFTKKTIKKREEESSFTFFYCFYIKYYLITPNSLPTLMNAAIALSKCSCS